MYNSKLMKKITLLLLVSIITTTTTFGNKVTAIVSGAWNTPSTWNTNKKPADNDTIVIPAGKTVQMSGNLNLKNVVIIIYGTLDLDDKAMKLDNASVVEAMTGGKIITQGNKDEISIGNVVKFMGNGNNNSLSGPAIASSSTGSYPTGFATLSTLPVTFTAFTAAANGSDITLTWSTSQEFNNNNFEVQRSFDGSNWTVISVVMGAGNANTAANYKVVDHNMTAAAAYYRIRQVDLDGNYSFSAVKTISSQLNTTAKIYAADKNVHVDLGNSAKSNVHITVYNSNGQALLQQTYANATGKISLSNINVNTGIYIVQVTDAKGWMASAKILL